MPSAAAAVDELPAALYNAAADAAAAAAKVRPWRDPQCRRRLTAARSRRGSSVATARLAQMPPHSSSAVATAALLDPYAPERSCISKEMRSIAASMLELSSSTISFSSTEPASNATSTSWRPGRRQRAAGSRRARTPGGKALFAAVGHGRRTWVAGGARDAVQTGAALVRIRHGAGFCRLRARLQFRRSAFQWIAACRRACRAGTGGADARQPDGGIGGHAGEHDRPVPSASWMPQVRRGEAGQEQWLSNERRRGAQRRNWTAVEPH